MGARMLQRPRLSLTVEPPMENIIRNIDVFTRWLARGSRCFLLLPLVVTALLVFSKPSYALAPFLAADIHPGPGDSRPEELTVYNNELYFQASRGNTGTELWKFDGKDASLAANINQNGSSFPSDLVVWGNSLYFGADDGSNGTELWKFNGTNASLAADIKQGSGNSSIEGLAVYKNQLYFLADDGTTGEELWRFNGTTASLAAEIIPGSFGGIPGDLTVYKNRLYFRAADGSNGFELWRFNGSTAALVADINPAGDTNDSSPDSFAIYHNDLYFRADDGSNGAELWKFNGTTASLAANINPSGGSFPGGLTVYNNELYFQADDGTSGRELWKFDGTTASLVADINPGPGSSIPAGFAVGDQLYFTADDGIHGTELWKFNGTTASLAADIFPGPDSAFPFPCCTELMVLGNQLYFSATDGTHGRELFKFVFFPSELAQAAAALVQAQQSASLKQVIDSGFLDQQDLQFDYYFATTSGELQVKLDGAVLATFSAPEILSDRFTTVSLPINLRELFDQPPERLELEFLLAGDGQISSLLLDNVSWAGLANGDFSRGDLRGWTTEFGADGFVGVYAGSETPSVPEPTSIALWLSGGLLTCLGRHRRL